jgi:hypothetical protein
MTRIEQYSVALRLRRLSDPAGLSPTLIVPLGMWRKLILGTVLPT